MGRIEKTVFISYRRTNASWALAIFQDLTQNGYDVFFDFDGIASGDFERTILENIRARAHFLVLLTPSALERCHDPSDWLRREVEVALDNRRNIVPLMLEGCDFGAPGVGSQLKGKLAKLKQYNALNVPVDYFGPAMERLRNRYLNVPLDAVLHPVSEVAQQGAIHQSSRASKAPPVRKNDLTAEEWFERGVQNPDLDEKLRCYTRAIRLNSGHAIAFNNRGLARKDKGDLEGALEDCNEAIRLSPDLSAAFNNRGLVRRAQGDQRGALEDYNEAIRLDPNDAWPYNNRGLVRQEQGDLEGALEDCNEAIRLNPDLAAAFNNRGLVRGAQGDAEGALEDYSEAIRLEPDGVSFNNRGHVRKTAGDLKGALEDYDEAIRLSPDSALFFFNRADAREDSGDLEGALSDYNEAIRLRPDYAKAFNNRGLARRARGDLEGALADFDEAIRLDPNLAVAVENRAQVVWRVRAGRFVKKLIS
jgi:tetratricopeptide (TPR) repeat protein